MLFQKQQYSEFLSSLTYKELDIIKEQLLRDFTKIETEIDFNILKKKLEIVRAHLNKTKEIFRSSIRNL